MTSSVLTFLYWAVLLLVTLASLTCAAVAFKLHRQLYALTAIAGLGVALVLAAVPVSTGPSAFGIVLGMLALALAVVGGGPVAVLALDLATNNSVPPGQHGGIMVLNSGKPAPTMAGVSDPDTHEVLRGGVTIGILERLAVAGAILAGFPEAIAVVVAIKGVGRFTELAAAESRERFIIGTLASLLWACACAALVPMALV
ncbi:hypothetical protein [Cryobacterium sp. PH31-O1]|uniref:hypothetical protein n=1 Tax=Cryobacterium sp. PH31-O1 TaxID=3046306 RepID=UPI0024BBDD29|nr:hypothetical protein [Cryobacterium sp. PH31-O1]MDJ0339589.1 hypothetical protein [Cryobacterium sp. PH31-O1]